MSAENLMYVREILSATFSDFFKPWSEWFDTNGFTIPAINISEDNNGYKVSLAILGRKKEDFNIDISGNMLTVSSETKEENKHYTRKKYSYNSFSRSFTLPDEVIKEKIETGYTDGILEILLPKTKPTPKAANQRST